MASPYILTNGDLQYSNLAGQDFNVYLAFLNPVSVTTTWTDLNLDANGNWQPPPNFDCVTHKAQPYAPTVCLGPNRIGFVNEPLYFDGSRSYQRFDLPVVTGSYTWTITGPATITYYAGHSQIGVIWSSPGLYTVTLTVGGIMGNTRSSTRQVMVYQDRDNTLQGLISIAGLSGSLSNGGWQFQCTTVNSQVSLFNPDALAPGTYQPVVLLIETRFEIVPGVWVNKTIGPHGLFNPGYPYIDPRVLFDGYIQNGTVHEDVDKDTLSFSCVGPQMILQEAKTHQLGHYNCAYTSVVNGVPQGCKASPAGTGVEIGGLMTEDLIHHLLQEHCNIANFHDVHIWHSTIPTKPYSTGNNVASYSLIYTTLSFNEGTVWQNIQDLCTNEWVQAYCERDGSIRVGPQVNYRGSDYWLQPTLLGFEAAPFLINIAQDLGFNVGNTLATMTGNLPTLPALPMPYQFVHPWGHQPNPPQFLKPFGNKNTDIIATQSSLLGPPILCVFSDVPVFDQSSSAPDLTNLYPWIWQNWPQDLAIYPISFDIQENYTGRAALVKLIGTLYGHTSLWTSWYPQNTFQLVGDGSVSTVVSTLPASDWVLNESHVLPDVTSTQQANLVWNWWWEMARREYYARNMNYNASITLGIFTAATLGDIIAINRQNTTLGPRFNNKLFYVTELSYAIDLTARTWQTTLTLGEVTSVNIGPIQTPPNKPPKG